MKEKKLMIAALVLCAATFSCKKKDKCEDATITKVKLQGIWKENSSRYGKHYKHNLCNNSECFFDRINLKSAYCKIGV